MSTDKKQEVKAVKDAELQKTEVKKTEVKKAVSKKVESKKTDENHVKKTSSNELKHVLSGEVVSVKMDKTIVVLMELKVKHPVYGKYIKRSSRFFVHDESNKAKLGQTVRFRACKPYSKNKTWTLVG